MTTTQKLLRLLSTALIAALVAGSVTNVILGATPLAAAWPAAYLWALAAALSCPCRMSPYSSRCPRRRRSTA